MPTSRATTILYFDVVTLLYQIKNHYSSLFINLDSSTPSVFAMQSHLPLSPSAVPTKGEKISPLEKGAIKFCFFKIFILPLSPHIPF